MLPNDVKPAICTNFTDPQVKQLQDFITYLQTHYHDEPNLEICIRVLECLMFIKLNSEWFKYAIKNKNTDATLFKDSRDKDNQVLRAHNDMSFHVLSYSDPEAAVRDYAENIGMIEKNIQLLTENSKLARIFIRKIEDSSIGCMEQRLSKAMDFLYNPTLLKLDDIFHSFILFLNKKKVQITDTEKFLPQLIAFFDKELGIFAYHNNEEVEITWAVIRNYLLDFQGFEEKELTPNILSDALLRNLYGNTRLHFSTYEIARNNLNLFKLFLANEEYRLFKNTVIVTHENLLTNSIYFYFEMPEKLFKVVTERLKIDPKSIKYLSIMEDEKEKLKKLVNKNKKNEIISCLNDYPALLNFPLFDNEYIIHRLIWNRNLGLLKFLVENYNINLNAKLMKPDLPYSGATPVALTSGLAKNSEEMLKYLLANKADASIPLTNGQTALSCAVLYNLQTNVKILVSSKVNLNPNHIANNDSTALTTAIQYASADVLKLILTIPGIDINLQNKNHESAIFTAIACKNVEKVKILIATDLLDYDIQDANGRNCVEYAQSLRCTNIATLLADAKQKQIDDLEKATAHLRPQHSFEVYVQTLKKCDDGAYVRYMKDLLAAKKNNTQLKKDKIKGKNKGKGKEIVRENQATGISSQPLITEQEKLMIEARKYWTEVVSLTYTNNQEYLKNNDVKTKVIERILQIDPSIINVDEIYDACINFLRNQTAMVFTFNATFLKRGISDFQLLNVYENNTHPDKNYLDQRLETEKSFFKFLPPKFNKLFLANKHAQPRYAALKFMDDSRALRETTAYGHSFILFKQLCYFNAIFLAGNPFIHKAITGQDYIPCTVHNMEFILLQCPYQNLDAILHFVRFGKLPFDFSQDVWTERGGYLVAMIPGFDLLKSEFIESIHLESRDCYLRKKDRVTLKKQTGINFFNKGISPYFKIHEKLKTAFSNNDEETIIHLLEKYPALLNMTDSYGYLPLHNAAARGNMRLLQKMVEWHCDFSAKASGPFSAIAIAANNDKNFHALLYIIAIISKQTNKPIQAIINENAADALLFASKYGSPLIFNYFLEKLEYVDHTLSDLNEDNMLMLACRHGHNEIAATLIEKSTDIKAVNKFGMTALHYALKLKNEELVNKLLLRGADPNTICKSTQDSILTQATRHFSQETFASILSLPDIDLNHKNNTGETALLIATRQNDYAKVALLLQKYAAKGFSPQSAATLSEALMYANKNKLNLIALAIANVYLPMYVEKTRLRGDNDYKTKIKFCGMTLFNCGYSSDKKLTAANAIIKNNPLAQFKGELTNGELGIIASSLRLKI